MKWSNKWVKSICCVYSIDDQSKKRKEILPINNGKMECSINKL